MPQTQQWVFLRVLRERSRITIAELADRVNMARDHIGRIENGRATNPGWERVEAWARELGVSMRLIGYIHDHPALDDQAVDWIARMVVGQYSETQIIEEIEARYGPVR